MNKCCCQFNPSEDQEVVLASNCCPVHNINPIPCQVEPKCEDEDNDNFEGEQNPVRRAAALELFRKWRKESVQKERLVAAEILFKHAPELTAAQEFPIINAMIEYKILP